MSQNPLYDESILVQVIAWCCQAPSHYLSQCWPRFISPDGVTRPHWVNQWCSCGSCDFFVIPTDIHDFWWVSCELKFTFWLLFTGQNLLAGSWKFCETLSCSVHVLVLTLVAASMESSLMFRIPCILWQIQPTFTTSNTWKLITKI